MKKIFILTFLISAVVFALGQEVVSSAGETQTVSDLEISWTIGEPVIETFSLGIPVLTQGFHQSKLIVTAIDENRFSEIELKVYEDLNESFK